MEPNRQFDRPGVSGQTLLLSAVALVIPAIVTLFFAERVGVYEPFLWLLALVPAFLLAYHRGSRGVLAAMGLGMATLILVQLVASSAQRSPERGPLFIGVVLAFLGTGAGIAILAELIHRERSRAESAALTDALTGIPNRRLAELVLPREFAGAQRGRDMTVVLFDLDHFKGFNDQYGHAAGDEALRRFAEVLMANTRTMNLSARWGGEEFIGILSSTPETGAMVFAERVRDSLAENQPAVGTVTVTAGVAGFRAGMKAPHELLEAADHALYQAKAAGRDRVGLFRPDPDGEGGPATGD